MRDIYHVTPTNDLKEHITHGCWCHCRPEVRSDNEGDLVIHNAYDAREFFENCDEDDFPDLRTCGEFVVWTFPIDKSNLS